MQITNVSELKLHARIDNDVEDAILVQYIEAAEQYVLTYTGRSLSELKSQNVIAGGERDIPPMIKQAVWLLAGHFVKMREATGSVQAGSVPFALEAMLRPFTRLTTKEVCDA